MGMVPETVVAMLACARVVSPHSVVFGGLSVGGVRDGMNDGGAKVLLTQDAAWRRGQVVPLKQMADEAVEQTPGIRHVVVLRRVGRPIEMKEGRDIWWHDWIDRPATAVSMERARTPSAFDAEHPLFILYTSGSTGKPKGVLHTSAGYLAGAHVTTKYVFDVRDEDTYWCTADVGWVTGHSYIVYGPLSCGATCMMYEGAPNFPDWGRFWNIIERHGVNILYTAPAASRARPTRGASSSSRSRGPRWRARFGATMSAISRRIGTSSPMRTSLATGPDATATGISGSSGALTTCSTSRGTASAPRKSRARWS